MGCGIRIESKRVGLIMSARMVLKDAAAADATSARCCPGAIRPSSTSIGTMFAPRAAMAAPFTRSITVWLPVPLALADAATAAGSVSCMQGNHRL